MTIDEELVLLEDSLRKLKIEFDIYFNGARKRPPTDLQWRVESGLKRLNDNSKMNFGQRFRLNAITSRYALFNDMWRQRVKLKEEGREEPWKQRRQEKPPQPAAGATPATPASFRIQWHDPEQEADKVDRLFQALVEAKKKVGENTDSLSLDSFKRFVKAKTDQLKKDLSAKQVEYSVEVEGGQVRLKAKGS